MLKKSLQLAALTGAMALASAGAYADFTAYQTQTIPLQLTNWTDNSTLTYNLFDTTLGTLTDVDFVLTGYVDGLGDVENRDAAAANITLTLSANITVSIPGSSSTLTVSPSDSEIVNLGAFDGVIDFGGTSGASNVALGNLPGGTSVSQVLTSAGDLALFIGPGTITLPAAANASSVATGSGNLISSFTTNAGAQLQLRYSYTPTQTPEPASLALMGLGLAGMGLLRRRRSV